MQAVEPQVVQRSPASTPAAAPSATATATAPGTTHTVDDITLGPNHFKLLYLIGLYAVASNSARQNERWVRHVPLLVLMFEGIMRGKFEFDYAPASMRLSFKGKTLRRWVNVSREGKAAIDDLWQLRLINGLKLSSDDFQPITAYQVSMKGQLVLQQLPSALKDDIDSFVYPPPPLERKLVVIGYDGDRFVLKSGAYSKPSTITESEDVSYVSSPFLPRCLRSNGFYHITERSNRDRADECARGFSNITKKTSEAMSIGDVYALIGEWVPFGSNQIVALNERMGALDRCQGGILTSFVDKSPTDTQFRVPVGQTQVRILDFDFVRFINFEAESHFPETPGIVQIEHFGMHLNSDGSLIYGVKVEAIMDRKGDDISIDHLSRLLVDIHQDSSLLVNDLLSRYQLGLLEMIYLGDSFQRNKFNCILAKQIRPKLPASEYVKNPLYANELAQVLGDIVTSHDLSPDDVLVVGKAGCLFCGPNVFRYENVFTAYVGLVCRDIFIKNFFARTFVLDASLKEIRHLIRRVHREPAAVMKFFVGGVFIFDVIDRLDAGSWNMHVPEWARKAIIDPLLGHPFAWWSINMFILAGFTLLLLSMSKHFAERAFGFCTVTFEVNRKMSAAHLDELLATRRLRVDISRSIRATPIHPSTRCRTAKWREFDVRLWGAAPPEVELTYDAKHGFLLFVTLRFDAKRAHILEDECIRRFTDIFSHAGVLVDDNSGANSDP